MKRKPKTINSPDELSKTLSYSSPATWITLISVILLLAGFFVWSFVYKIKVKVSGTATITSGSVTLRVDEKDLGSLKEGQKVYISGIEGQIVSFNDNQPVVSSFQLNDGDYNYYIVVKEMKPIDFWFQNNK